MKKFNKYYFLSLLIAMSIVSCETTELDITEDPNALTPTDADIDFFLNNIQEDFTALFEGNTALNEIGSELTRTAQLSGRNYLSTFLPVSSDGEWATFYAVMLTDIRAMIPLAEEAGFTRHIAIAQFLEAYAVTAMVDFFGDIPYSEAIQGVQGLLNPSVDPGADIYAEAFALLDQAEINFTNETAGDPANDFFYGTNYDQWLRAINTLRLKLNLQTRLVDPAAVTRFNAIIAEGNFIQDNADDMQFSWPATSNANPDVRHPRYAINYTATGVAEYNSNWLMNQMDVLLDPRIRYYFFRQNEFVPGQEIPFDEQLLNCSSQNPPQHYVDGGFTFCNLPNGYWGRDHGDDNGIPPDNFNRSTFGVYPAGGRFDDDSFNATGLISGANGAGISPFLTASLVRFYQAEMAMVSGDEAAALTLMQEGLTLHINKVMTFGTIDTTADFSFAPTDGQVTGFINNISIMFNNADTAGRWDILMEEFLVTTYGQGHEAYNAYRRTGFPTTLQANLEPNPGIFIRSLFYPAASVNNNSSITQKASNNEPVFWDNNPTAPVAN